MNVLNELIDGMIQEVKHQCDYNKPCCAISNVLDYVDYEKYESLCDGECDGSCKGRIANALEELKLEVNGKTPDKNATVENYHNDVLDELKGIEDEFWEGANPCAIADRLEELGYPFHCECENCRKTLSRHIEKCIALEESKQSLENKQAIKEKTSDNVNHPSHYKLHKHECIDEMVAVFGIDAVKHFCACNAWKYRYRANAKNGEEDLKKADWYIEKLMELEKDKNGVYW